MRKKKISLSIAGEVLERVGEVNRSEWFEGAAREVLGRREDCAGEAGVSSEGIDPWGKLGELERRVEALERGLA